MTEAEWLSHGDHLRFLHHLCESGSERQLRLFACACCRRIWRFMADERIRNALDIAERWADRKANRSERKRAAEEVHAARADASEAKDWTQFNAASAVCYMIRYGDRERTAGAVCDVTGAAFYAIELGEGGKREDEEFAQSLLAADIMGNPFRTVTFMTFEPAWRRARVVATLAKEMYEERAFDRMPILADALQGAGCDNADVLEHCRGTLPHIRGCWVVDLILGKE